MKKRIKKSLSTPASRDDAEFLMTQLAQASNSRRQLAAQLDEQILTLKSKYESGLAAYDEGIKEFTDQLHAWAQANPDQFKKGCKSIQFTSGTLGFRTGTPKLVLMSRKWTWETALDLVERFLPNFIRSKPEIDKEAIIAQHEELEPSLSSCGLKVTQEETFYVDPDLSTFEPRQNLKSEAA
jgi:phage host-nuclease inhibitor protein Gam